MCRTQPRLKGRCRESNYSVHQSGENLLSPSASVRVANMPERVAGVRGVQALAASVRGWCASCSKSKSADDDATCQGFHHCCCSLHCFDSFVNQDNCSERV